MIKNFLKISLFFLFFTTTSFACDIRSQIFGSKPDNLQNNIHAISFSDPMGGLTVILPFESFCAGSSQLFGSMAIFFYLNNELVQVRYERHNFNDRALMDIAINKYGNFKRGLGSDKNKWIGNHSWRYNKEIVTYLASANRSGSVEKLEITSIIHKDKISQYFTTREQWKK